MDKIDDLSPDTPHFEDGVSFDDELDGMTVFEVAERLGVVPATIRREIKRGKLKAIHVGRSVRITKAALLKYVKEA